jgi:hypothetical protein
MATGPVRDDESTDDDAVGWAVGCACRLAARVAGFAAVAVGIALLAAAGTAAPGGALLLVGFATALWPAWPRRVGTAVGTAVTDSG